MATGCKGAAGLTAASPKRRTALQPNRQPTWAAVFLFATTPGLVQNVPKPVPWQPLPPDEPASGLLRRPYHATPAYSVTDWGAAHSKTSLRSSRREPCRRWLARRGPHD